MLHVENGVCVSIEDKGVIVCIGDARVSANTQGAGTLRGTIVELFREEDLTSNGTNYTKEDAENDQNWFQSALAKIFEGTGETFSNTRAFTNRTLSRRYFADPDAKQSEKSAPDWNLAKLYMAILMR